MSASTAVDAPLEQTDSRRWIALAVIVVAQFMVVLDVAIVNVALPSIKTDLNFSEQSLQPASPSSRSARCWMASLGRKAR